MCLIHTLVCVLGSYCLVVTLADHCSEFRRTNCIIPNSQCPEKAMYATHFLSYWFLLFLLNSKRHPNFFLANQSWVFKTELNCLGFNISLKSHRFTHIIFTRISASPITRKDPSRISAAFKWVLHLRGQNLISTASLIPVPWVSLVTAPCSRTCGKFLKQNNLNRVKQLIDKFIDYFPLYLHTCIIC